MGYASRDLEMHPCTDEEFGFTRGPGTLFYPIEEQLIREVQTWKKKFKCVAPADYTIWGDYNSAKAQQLTIQFRTC